MFKIEWIDYELALLVGISSLDDPLEASIAKWEQVVAFYEEYPGELLQCGGSSTCALCCVYSYQLDAHACSGCPVAEATGKQHCYGTPYRTYNDAVDPTAAHLAAVEELAFLKSLR